ncbi:MAG: amino acid adenylation domain-containing protein [Crocinitomix sp.]|nr:amino acid adenylation domain-containing protein [Crocinitomix sp.]
MVSKLSDTSQLTLPETATEKALAEIWKEVLNQENIGRNSHFLRLGGNSIKLIRLKSAIRIKFGLEIDILKLFTNGVLLEQAKLLETAEYSIQQKIPKSANQADYAVSSSQKRLWILSQMEEVSAVYNMPRLVHLVQDIEQVTLQNAINAVVEKYEILRTVFLLNESGEVRQKIKRNVSIQLKAVDIKNEGFYSPLMYLEKDALIAFDLENGPLLRMAMIKDLNGRFLLYLNIHHIIGDEWSLMVLEKEIFDSYKLQLDSVKKELDKPEIQYKDFAEWEIAALANNEFEASREFWMGKLARELPVLDFPFAKKRPEVQGYNGQILQTKIATDTSQQFKNFCTDNGGTLFIGALVTWGILISRYTGQEELIFGTPVAGRDRMELEDQIGCFVNTLPLLCQVDLLKDFHSNFEEIKNHVFTDFQHQQYPFNAIVDMLDLPVDTSRNTLFDIMLTTTGDISANASEESVDFEQEIISGGSCLAKFDMDIAVHDRNNYLELSFTYNTDVYNEQDVKQIIKHYKSLLETLLEKPHEKVGKINYLGKYELTELVEHFNGLKVNYPSDTVLDLFQAIVAKHPNNIAVKCAKRKLTYRELDKLSGQLAKTILDNKKIQKPHLIGLKLERSEWMIVAILGILKSKAAYVPIDPTYPDDRIEYIIKDSELDFCIDEEFIDAFIAHAKPDEINKDAIDSNLAAYVIYTSGSTGKPKGVEISHASLADYVQTALNTFQLSANDCVLQQASISFDVSIEEIFVSLCSGAQLVIMEDGARDISELIQKIEQETVTFLSTTPLVINELNRAPERLKSLQTLVSGGDELKSRYIKNIFPHIKVYNTYGPTESTVCITYHEVKKLAEENIIGKPIANRKVYIVNPLGVLQPIGVTGEIWVSGSGLGKRYLNRPELTKEKFIENPFDKGTKLYKTGDLGRWLRNGTIKFEGRLDDQVKIRGYRIELSEIEKHLVQKPEISDAVILVIENEQGIKELEAYLVLTEPQSILGIREFLGALLPLYMIPSYFFEIDKILYNTNGKVDKKAIKVSEVNEIPLGTVKIKLETENEEILASVWIKIFNAGKVGKQDNFYGLGGDSIKSIQISAELKKNGFLLKVDEILRIPVLEDAAKMMRKDVMIIDQGEVVGPVDLTPVQLEFFSDPGVINKNHYNQSVLLKSKKKIDHEILKESIAVLVEHHDALRMTFSKELKGFSQYNKPFLMNRLLIEFFDLRKEADALETMAMLGEELQRSMDMFSRFLFSVAHFRLSDGDRIAIISHHLLVDGVSWRIILEDIQNIYEQLAQGKTPELPAKSTSYRDWAGRLPEYAKELRIGTELEYWKNIEKFSNHNLPTDYPKKAEAFKIDKIASFNLDEELTDILQKKVNIHFDSEINDVLLAAFASGLKETFDLQKTLIKMEGHGREDIFEEIDINRTVGWFTSIYPFLLETTDKRDDLVGRINKIKQTRKLIPNKGIGYGILKYLTNALKTESNPEIVFNYLGDFSAGFEIGAEQALAYSSEYIGPDVSEDLKSQQILHISGLIGAGELQISIRYPGVLFKAETIDKLIGSVESELIRIIKAASNSENHKEAKPVENTLSFNQQALIKERYSSGTFGPIVSNGLTRVEIELKVKEFIAQFNSLTEKIIFNKGAWFGRQEKNASNCVDFYQDLISDKSSFITELTNPDHEFNAPFDISNDALIRVMIVEEKGSKEQLIFLKIHHIITDDFSNKILKRELENYLHNGKIAGEYTSNSDFSKIQLNYITSKEADAKRAYWSNKMAEISESKMNDLSGDQIIRKKEVLIYKGEQFEAFKKMATDSFLPMMAFHIAAHQMLMEKLYEGDAFVQGILSDSRLNEVFDLDLDKTVGAVSNIFPIAVKKGVDRHSLNYLKHCHNEYLEGRENQIIPLQVILNDIQNKVGLELKIHGEFNYQIVKGKIEENYFSNNDNFTMEINDKSKKIHYICTAYNDAFLVEIDYSISKTQNEKKTIHIIESYFKDLTHTKTELT